MLSPYDMANALRDQFGDEGVDTIADDAGAIEDAYPDVAYPHGLGPQAGPGRQRQVFDVNAVPQNGTVQCQVEFEPDFWVFHMVPAANTGFTLHLDNTPSGVPDGRFGSGGYGILPGRGQYLTLTSTGASAISGTITAVRGLHQFAVGGSS